MLKLFANYFKFSSGVMFIGSEIEICLPSPSYDQVFYVHFRHIYLRKSIKSSFSLAHG